MNNLLSFSSIFCFSNQSPTLLKANSHLYGHCTVKVAATLNLINYIVYDRINLEII